jgi:signal transduction histidine kinase
MHRDRAIADNAFRQIYEGFTYQARASHVRAVQRAVDTASRLIRDLLDVARIEAGQLFIEPETLDVASVVSEARDAFFQQAKKKSIVLEHTVGADLPHAFGDRDRVLQVFGNLLGNAIKFTTKGGRIRVRSQGCLCGLPALIMADRVCELGNDILAPPVCI